MADRIVFDEKLAMHVAYDVVLYFNQVGHSEGACDVLLIGTLI